MSVSTDYFISVKIKYLNSLTFDFEDCKFTKNFFRYLGLNKFRFFIDATV